MSLYNINNKLICGTYGFITACENYTPPTSSYILHLTIYGGDGGNANMVWNLTPNALSGRFYMPWDGPQVPQSELDAINSTNQNNAYPYGGHVYWNLGETYSPVSFKYKSDNNTWRSLNAELYFAEEQGSSALLDSKRYQYNTGATTPVTITLQAN